MGRRLNPGLVRLQDPGHDGQIITSKSFQRNGQDLSF